MLDAYATERWEVRPIRHHHPRSADIAQTILHYMVSSGTDQSPSKPSAGVLHLLQKSGLMIMTMTMT